MKKIIATVVLLGIAISSSLWAKADINLSSMNFNYDIYDVNGSKKMQPLEVFSGNGKTYIRFSDAVTYQNKPTLYIGKNGKGQMPKYRWQKPYLIIDDVVDYAKLADPSNDETLFNIKRVDDPYIPVTPSPYVTNETFDGFLVNLGVGAGMVGDSSLNNFAGNVALGWDWALNEKVSRHWLFGFEVGGAFGGKTDGTGIDQPSGTSVSNFNPDVLSWNVDLLFRVSYVFFSGVYLTGKLGPAYMQDRADSFTSGGTTVDSFNEASIVPEVAAEAGYLFNSGMSLGLKYNYLFGLQDTVSNGVLSANIAVHF